MKTAAVEVKSVPDNLLDEVLGPLPAELLGPDRHWLHLGPIQSGPIYTAWCGHSGPARGPGFPVPAGHGAANRNKYCPDCVRLEVKP